MLSESEIKALEAQRVLTIQDLVRVARDVAGQRAAEKYLPGVNLTAALERAALFMLPDLPLALAAELIRIGVTSPADLAKREAFRQVGASPHT